MRLKISTSSIGPWKKLFGAGTEPAPTKSGFEAELSDRLAALEARRAESREPGSEG